MRGRTARFLLQRGREKPFVIAHRGASGYAPENTKAAYRQAVQLGVVAVETDVHLTQDKVIVTIHDATVDRTTSGSGAVAKLTYAQLKEFDAGSWFSNAFVTEQIPSLDAFLEVLGTKAIPVIEMKGGEGIEYLLAKRFETRPEGAFFFSFDADKIQTLKQCCPESPCLYLLPWTEAIVPCDVQYLRQALAMNMDAVGVQWERLSEELVGVAHENGLSVFVYTVNTLIGVRRCLDLGVDAIISDVPDRVFDWMNE